MARRKGRLDLARQAKIAAVMREFKAGTLKSGRSGKPVTDRRQAIAIALAEARRLGKRERGRPLTAKEIEQRREAARARWRRYHHAAETTPSFRQASAVLEPKRSAGLVQSTRIFDTRTAEIGTLESPYRWLAVKLHVPQAYKEGGPDLPLPKTIRRKAPRWLETYDEAGNRRIDRNIGSIPTVPYAEFLEAMRYPKMRDISTSTAKVLARNRQGAIDRGYETGLIPAFVDRRVAQRAYNHAAAMAMHKAGLIDYDFALTDETKRAFRPLKRFMLYAQRRVFSELNSPEHGLKGKWGPFREEFGHLYVQRKHGKETGHVRYRMRDNQVFIKGEKPDSLEKLLPTALAMARGAKSVWRLGRSLARTRAARWASTALSPFTTVGVKLGQKLGRSRTAAATGGTVGFGLDLGGAAMIGSAIRNRYASNQDVGDTTRYLRRYFKIEPAGLVVLHKVERPVKPITAALRRRALALAKQDRKKERLYGEAALMGGTAGMYAGMGLSQRYRRSARMQEPLRAKTMRLLRAGARFKRWLNVRHPHLSRPLQMGRNTLVNLNTGRKIVASYLSRMMAARGRAMLGGSLVGAGLGALMAREPP